MDFYMSGWKDVREVNIPPVKKKGFSQDVIIRNKVEPRVPHVMSEHEFEMDDDKTVLLHQEMGQYDDLEATVLLNGPKRLSINVIRLLTGESKEIKGSTFVLGKASDCDFVIDGNPTISRRHAQIIKENGDYLLEDLNSSNHTYVNDDEIDAPVKILHNMVFRMSDEEFKISLELK